METRRSGLKKRRMENDTENELLQKQMLTVCTQKGFEIGPRDIIIGEGKISVKIEDAVIKQETNDDLEEGREFNCVQSEVKFETEEQKVLAVSAEIICSDDCSLEKSNSCKLTRAAESSKEQMLCNELRIKSEPQFSNIEVEPHQNAKLEKVLPMFVDYLKLKNILLCRKVCKKWRKIIDSFLESKITKEPFVNETYLMKMKHYPLEQLSRQKYKRIKYAYHFNSNLNEFIDKMKIHSGLELSPFVGGAEVSIQMTNLEFDDSSKIVQHFIQTFGKYLTCLKFKEVDVSSGDTTTVFKETLLRCLKNCTNLKALTLRTKPGGAQCLENSNESSHDIFQLQHSDFPKHLKSFSLNMDEVPNAQPNILMMKLFKPFLETQLQKLTIIWNKNLKLIMPQLKELSLVIRNEGKGNYFRVVSESKWLEAPIEKLHLKIDLPINIHIIYLLKMLNKFPTVRYLKLDYGMRSRIHFAYTDSDQLHNIHTLELTNFSDFSSIPYGVFRSFPNLKYFNMRINWLLKCETRETLNSFHQLYPDNLFLGTSISIYETRVWQICTQLQLVIVQCHIHKCNDMSKCFRWQSELCRIENVVGSREGYHRYCKSSLI